MLGRAGIVDQDIEPATFGRRVGQSPAILIARDISLNHFHPTSLGYWLVGRARIALSGVFHKRHPAPYRFKPVHVLLRDNREVFLRGAVAKVTA
jgi:hypothetical protein